MGYRRTNLGLFVTGGAIFLAIMDRGTGDS